MNKGHTWHPCSQMKDYEAFPPIRIKKAKGHTLILEDGRHIIDAIGSWWCKPFGHQYSPLKKAVLKQTKRFEHVILAGTTSNLIEQLSHKLCQLNPAFSKAFYACDGSTAIEIALKMALQFHKQSQSPQKTRFAYLQNAYHGESMLAYSVSDLSLYSKPFESLSILEHKNLRLPLPPGPSGKHDPHWNTFPENSWKLMLNLLNENHASLAALIVEPIVQGAAGMKLHSPELLKRLRSWTQQHNVLLIADEIMTGLGRTGKALACDHASITPDILCLMKGLSAGWAPLSAVITTEKIYKAFYGDYHDGVAFMHSNTYSGYALGAAAALETLKLYEKENWFEKVSQQEHLLRELFEDVAAETKALTHIRSLGFIAAADLHQSQNPISPKERIGYRVYQQAVKEGVLLRPLGDTLYLFPPFNIPKKALHSIATVMKHSINHVMHQRR